MFQVRKRCEVVYINVLKIGPTVSYKQERLKVPPFGLEQYSNMGLGFQVTIICGMIKEEI